jgi:hypothetical protein
MGCLTQRAPDGATPAIQAAFGQVWRDNGMKRSPSAPPVTLTVSWQFNMEDLDW